ncbi:DUF983 domain-containing protein [Novosphingobium sp. EMRT-2]|uniref:DUF983 domain-containing protein n=1 Tax=Novosphingobium sp. EMRT-2 TaxID=2571749 RepID=UPI003513596B
MTGSSLDHLAPDGDRAPGMVRPSLAQAIKRGFVGRCPRCARAKLFRAFLKPVDRCPDCQQDWSCQRADDFPAYLAILLTGHLVAPLIIAVELDFSPPAWVQMTLWPAIVAAMVLALIQPAKGAVIAAQWRLGLHGFAASDMQAADADANGGARS